MLVLKNCRLVDELTVGNKGNLGHVIIDNGIIKQILNIGDQIPDSAEIIDCKNKTLIPGLIEMHAHLYSSTFNEGDTVMKTDLELLGSALSFASTYLEAGYTTVRDCGSMAGCALGAKYLIDNGFVEGPDIQTCGLIMSPTETGNESFPNLYYEADGYDEMIKGCRQQFKDGAGFIKLMGSGAFLNEGGVPGLQICTEDEFKACVDAADMKGSYVCAHCHGTDSIKAALRAGVRTVEHGCFIDDEAIEMLKDNDKSYLVPTGAIALSCFDNLDEMSEDLRQKCVDYTDVEIAGMKKAFAAELKLGFGSDIDREFFIETPGAEFIARKELYEFSDLEILKQATKYSAQILKIDDVEGTVEAGKNGNLVLVDGNPDEDILFMKKLPALVLKRGKIIKNNIKK